MKRHLGCALVCAFLAAESVPAQPPVMYVGEVIIVGNTITPDATIREALALNPGQELSAENVRAAEQRLLELDLFRVDPERDIRPSVTILDGGPFKDILVKVQEKPQDERIWIQATWPTVWALLAFLILGLTWRFVHRRSKFASD